MTQARQGSIYEDVAQVMNTIAAFTTVLERETAALKDMDFQAVDKLQPDKRDLTRRYHECVSALVVRREEVSALDSKTRENLIRVRTAFTVLLDENMRSLDAAKDGAKRLSERILDIARKSVTEDRQTNYSAQGRGTSYKTAMSSLKLNEEL